jgi:Domain of unknown function (DUF4336)
MLTPLIENLWVEARPLRFFGLETGTRMTVVRLASGGLFVHSPVALDAATKRAVDELGPVKAIVAPSCFHHLYAGEWASAYPDALLCACPGLDKKRSDLAWKRVLSDEPEPAWAGELDQVFFSACAPINEVVFFHRPSKTIVCADFIFNLANHPSLVTRTVARLTGNREPGLTLLERRMIRDKAAARAQVGRVLAWGAERVVLAHGEIIERDGSEVIERAFRWL